MQDIYYDSLALVYDSIMNHVPYDKWVEDLQHIFNEYDISANTILDCGCGTGAMSIRLAKKGYAVTAVDISEQMLLEARQRACDEQLAIRFLQLDVSSMQISEQQDVIISYFDVINYLDDKALVSFFDSAYNILKNRGYLLFDISTEYKMKHELGKQSFFDNSEDISYIWNNHYDEDDKILEFDISFFVQKFGEENQDEYVRYDECHRLFVHDLDKIIRLSQDKFEFVRAFDGDTLASLEEDSKRMLVLLRAK